MTIQIFVSYSHRDNDHRVRLTTHMAPLLREKDVEVWFDGDIEPGKAITPAIRKALRETDIFLALGSSNYLESEYCYRKEYQPMLRKSKQGRPRVVVALVGMCDWPNTEMARSKMLPNDAKSVEQHGLRNKAYLEIVQGLRRIVRAVRQEKGKAQAEEERKAAEKTSTGADRRKRIRQLGGKDKKSARDTKVATDKPQKPKAKPSSRKSTANGEKTKRSAPARLRTTSGTKKPH